MDDILTELQKCSRLNGDTYSSMEVLGMVGRAGAEIKRLRALVTSASGMLGEARSQYIEARPPIWIGTGAAVSSDWMCWPHMSRMRPASEATRGSSAPSAPHQCVGPNP